MRRMFSEKQIKKIVNDNAAGGFTLVDTFPWENGNVAWAGMLERNHLYAIAVKSKNIIGDYEERVAYISTYGESLYQISTPIFMDDVNEIDGGFKKPVLFMWNENKGELQTSYSFDPTGVKYTCDLYKIF